MGRLIDEVQQSRQPEFAHHPVHDLEEFPQQYRGGFNEVDGFILLRAVLIDLNQQEVLHCDIVVLAEELQKPEGPAECVFAFLPDLALHLILRLVAELLL